jgi:hypothetical protein
LLMSWGNVRSPRLSASTSCLCWVVTAIVLSTLCLFTEYNLISKPWCEILLHFHWVLSCKLTSTLLLPFLWQFVHFPIIFYLMACSMLMPRHFF